MRARTVALTANATRPITKAFVGLLIACAAGSMVAWAADSPSSDTRVFRDRISKRGVERKSWDRFDRDPKAPASGGKIYR